MRHCFLSLELTSSYFVVRQLNQSYLNEENTYLHVVRSAAFATMALFGLNYLRNKRPLSAVAPLLVFASFLCIYAPLYLFIRGTSYWWEWDSFAFMVVLVVVLFRENKAEAKKIFLNDW